VILASSHFGYPLSSTQVISGAVMGAGAAKRLSAVRWGVAGDIVAAWILTLPAAAALGALVYGAASVFGGGALGPALISVVAVAVLTAGVTGRRGGRTAAPAGAA
jgi:PiT family inorganic phosphate transporter